MEDGDSAILAGGGRLGQWHTYHDKSAGTQEPVWSDATPFTMVAADNGSLYAARTTGSGFSIWGAGFGFHLHHDGVMGAYDAASNGYKGITFKAKVGPGATPRVRLLIADRNTHPTGGKCDPEATATDGNRCHDYFGASIELEERWQKYMFAFVDLTQQGWGNNDLTAIDTTSLYFIHFQISEDATFDVWIDDIASYE